MKIYLVRHGKSEANLNKQILLHASDHTINLADLGRRQAAEAAKFLDGEIPYIGKTRVWVSPYNRTRQTAQIIYDVISKGRNTEPRSTAQVIVDKLSPFLEPRECKIDMREHIHLCEQQFGLFDGYLDDELPVIFPLEHAHYQKCVDQNGQFWARMPLGESRFDVALRVHQAFGTFLRDCDRHGIDRIIVVSHGVTIRAFVMQWLHLTPEWFNEEPNPRNCSVRLIDNGVDKGYIFIPSEAVRPA